MTLGFGVHITAWTLTLTLTFWQASFTSLACPSPPHLLLNVGVSMQHDSRGQSILGLQGHVDAEYDWAQLVPEVSLVLRRG